VSARDHVFAAKRGSLTKSAARPRPLFPTVPYPPGTPVLGSPAELFPQRSLPAGQQMTPPSESTLAHATIASIGGQAPLTALSRASPVAGFGQVAKRPCDDPSPLWQERDSRRNTKNKHHNRRRRTPPGLHRHTFSWVVVRTCPVDVLIKLRDAIRVEPHRHCERGGKKSSGSVDPRRNRSEYNGNIAEARTFHFSDFVLLGDPSCVVPGDIYELTVTVG
jgi:hypothetical protein